MTQISGWLLKKERLSAWLEWRHLAAIEISDARRIGVVRTNNVEESGTGPHAAEVGFPIRQSRRSRIVTLEEI